MALTSSSEFVDRIFPLKERLKLYDPTKVPTDQPKNDAVDISKAIPQAFIDAMIVRHAVYVEEQKVPLENELDEDDPRSFHWVAYASIPAKSASPESGAPDEKLDNNRRKSNSTKIPIGTIRLVPPPHPRHPNGKWETAVHKRDQAYVKLGRLAVIPELRSHGVSALLINTALGFVKEHPNDVLPYMDPSGKESIRSQGYGSEFDGLILVHAQTGVQKVWQKHGFVVDESMGKWDEEGIEHVGMWKTIDVTAGRKKPKISAAGYASSILPFHTST